MGSHSSRPLAKLLTAVVLCVFCYTALELAVSAWWLFEGSAGQGPCQLDNEGSWSIGIYKGSSPFSLVPLEQSSPRPDSKSAWPVSNPVLTCASVTDAPSNFVADPFLWQHRDGKLYMFYETKSSETMQGDIGVATSADGGSTWTHIAVVLDEPWHLSYPFVFEHEGQVYLLPEGSASGALRLYRATNFPTKWVLESTLFDRPIIDASLVQHNGSWWMFASAHDWRGAVRNGELDVYWADSPLGPWHAHVANPVMNGDRGAGARSAGRPIVHDGQLYRFGQDCDKTYGHRIISYRVDKLTRTEFEQNEVDLGFGGMTGGVHNWNGARFHHIDAQPLAYSGGEWIAAIDGDKVKSGPISRSMARRVTLILFPWVVMLGVWLFVGVFPACSRAMSLHSKRSHLQHAFTNPMLHTTPVTHSQYRPLHACEDSPTSCSSSGCSPPPPRLGPPPFCLDSPRQCTSPVQTQTKRRDVHSASSPYTLPSHMPRSESRSSKSRRRRRCQVLGIPIHVLLGFQVLVVLICAGAGTYLFFAPYTVAPRAFPVDGQYSKFTMLVMTYEARLPSLKVFIKHYSQCPSVSDVLVVWNKGARPDADKEFRSAVPVRIRVEERNSLNNRFNPDSELYNRAVLSLDDDIMMPCSDIERGFATWRMNPKRMVGFYPRLMEGSPVPTFRGEKYSIERGMYNAVLTGAAFMDASYAFDAYWAPEVAPAREFVDQVFNGEDLLMNFVLANRTGPGEFASEFVRPTRRVDISKLSGVGISHNMARFQKAADGYLAKFTQVFGRVPLITRNFDWGHFSPPICALTFLGCTYL